MASSVTTVESRDNRQSQHGSVGWYEYEWTSDGDDGSIDSELGAIYGRIIAVDTDPDALNAPDANYDLELQNDYGIDVMGGNLANRHTSTSERAYPAQADTPTAGTLTLIGSDCGNSKKGKIRIYVI